MGGGVTQTQTIIPPGTPQSLLIAGPPAPASPNPSVNYSDPASIAAATQAGIPSTNVTQAIWAAFLIEQFNAAGKVNGGFSLNGGGIPLTLNNIQNIERWMVAENNPSTWATRNNPLNASLGTSAADGTGSYANLTSAATNTAAMLAQSNMYGIAQALLNNAPPALFSAAVVQSPWASSHYGVAAAGAPSQYVQPGRGLDYIANISLPSQISAGSGATVLPADPGAATPGLGISIPGTAWIGELGTLLGDLLNVALWKRLGVFLGGTALMVVGLSIFLSTTKPGQQAISTASMAALA